MSVFAQNIVDMIVDYALRVAVLKKEFWPRQNHSGHNINFKAGEKPSEQGWTGRPGIHCRIKESLLIKIRDLKPALNGNMGSEKGFIY